MHSVLLVGCGNIGALYDIDKNEAQTTPRSHLGALIENGRYAIEAIVDPNAQNVRAAQNRWSQALAKTHHFESLGDVKGPYDVMIFATPSDDREGELAFTVAQNPQAIIIEKPVATSYAQGQKLLSLKTDALMSINYHRRFDRSYQNIREIIGTDKPLHITCTYGKGLLNYASHHIDLIHHWFGPIASAHPMGGQDATNLSAHLVLENGAPVTLIGVDGANYDVFDMQIMFADKRIDITNGGCEMRSYLPKSDLYYKNYTQLDRAQTLRESGPVGGLQELYEALDYKLQNKVTPWIGCSLEDAVQHLKILETIEKAHQ